MAATAHVTTRTATSLDQLVDVETPEQVVVSYTVAGLGSRAAAALLDALLCVLLFAALVTLTMWASARLAGGTPLRELTAPWVAALFIVGQFAIFWGYYVLFEALWDGQTPGKRRIGLRVVQDGGYSVSFAASAVRNLLRVVDIQPFPTYLLGTLTAGVSVTGKRIGDMVAGTIVVRERLLQGIAPAADGTAFTAPSALLTALLTDDELALLERFMARRRELAPERRAQLAGQLATRFRDRVPELGATPDTPFLARLVERERQVRSRGAAARRDTGARREQHALVAQGAARWRDFAIRLADAQRRGLGALGEEEVSEFVARYRELATDLARLRTASRGRELDAVFYLSRLVAGGHNLLYHQRRLDARAVWRFMMVDVPRELRRSWRPIAIAAACLFGPAAVSFEAVRRSPEVAAQLVPAELIERAEAGVVRARAGQGGYLPEEIAKLRGPLLASAITANNVQVTFVAFAFGVTAGIGTVLSLVFNGVAALGAPLGLYASRGIADQILGFVAPHGVLELAAICIAGGGGLLIAAAILLPGALTRRDALVVQGRRAIHLVAAAILLLLVAGLLEGNVSPLSWPNAWKYTVAVATAVGLGWYVTRGWGREQAVESRL